MGLYFKTFYSPKETEDGNIYFKPDGEIETHLESIEIFQENESFLQCQIIFYGSKIFLSERVVKNISQ